MSNVKPRTIWHKKTREIRDDYCHIVIQFKDGTYGSECIDPPLSACNFYKDMERWCYLDDLIDRYKKLSGDN